MSTTLLSLVSVRSGLCRTGAAAIAVALSATGAVHAQEQEQTARRGRDRQPIVFTIDVAEDLAGKFVPTLVKPDHTQPERGSFFVTEGRVFPGGKSRSPRSPRA